MAQTSFAERIESLKAGILGAIAAAISFSLISLVHLALIHEGNSLLLQSSNLLSWEGWVSGMSAAVAGFLFGITYRYVIRESNNSHLKSGAVLAFGLVRGFAQVDVGLTLQGNLANLVLLASESVLLFAIARFVVDWAMQRGLVNPFSSRD